MQGRPGVRCWMPSRAASLFNPSFTPKLQPQRHLSCSAASLVSVPGDMSSQPCAAEKQSAREHRWPCRTLMADERDVTARTAEWPKQNSAAATAAHNTAHLTLAASTASGEDLPSRKLRYGLQ